MVTLTAHQILYNLFKFNYINNENIKLYFYIGTGSDGDDSENLTTVNDSEVFKTFILGDGDQSIQPVIDDDNITITISANNIEIRSDDIDSMLGAATIGSAGIYIVEQEGQLRKLFSRITFNPITLLEGSSIDIEYMVKF